MNEYREWGKWAKHNPDRLGYPCQWFEMIMRDKVPVQSVSYNITDERAGQIDKAICQLAHYSVLQYQIFCFYFLCGFSERQIADMADERILGNKRSRVREELHKAIGFVNGALNNA